MKGLWKKRLDSEYVYQESLKRREEYARRQMVEAKNLVQKHAQELLRKQLEEAEAQAQARIIAGDTDSPITTPTASARKAERMTSKASSTLITSAGAQRPAVTREEYERGRAVLDALPPGLYLKCSGCSLWQRGGEIRFEYSGATTYAFCEKCAVKS